MSWLGFSLAALCGALLFAAVVALALLWAVSKLDRDLERDE